MSSPESILVFDVGGSHISVAVFDLTRNTLGVGRELFISNNASRDEILRNFELLGKEGANKSPLICGVALAMPSPFDYDEGISYMKHKYADLYGVNLRRELSERLGCDSKAVHFVNDAAAFLTGEIAQGAASNAFSAVGITLGTGVGSAFAIDREIVMQGRGVPPNGEIWNLAYKGGTIEDLISTRAIQRLYEERGGKREEVREIARLAAHQKPAREAFEDFGHQLGTALRSTCCDFNPEIIVLGGGIARAASLFLETTKAGLGELATALRISQLDNRAPLIGAATSWQQEMQVRRGPAAKVTPLRSIEV